MRLPLAFENAMQQLLGNEYPAFVAAMSSDPPASVRFNLAKPFADFAQHRPVPWCQNGYYLAERPVFTLDPLFHAGAYYVQEASSMFLEQWWNTFVPEHSRLKVLDLCAAPGGKSTHLLSLMNGSGVLVCNEPVPARNKILQHNLAKWGYSNFIITQNEPKQFEALGEYFDVIVADAPCSGEGMFRKDKNAIDEWSEKNVAQCALRQQNILASAFAILKPGGLLVYSTCTFNPHENEEQIKKLALHHDFEICKSENRHTGIVGSDYGYRFYPHKIMGEGFFTACLKKKGELKLTTDEHSHADRQNELLADYLKEHTRFKHTGRNGKHFAIPLAQEHTYKTLSSVLNVRAAGIYLGETKAKDFAPSQQLAWSNHLRSDLPNVEVNHEQAISYLRGETFTLPAAMRGWYLVRHKQLNLGWIKAIDHRFNNHYPKEWRIMMR